MSWILPKNKCWGNFQYIKLPQHSFFGRIQDAIICFRDLLTYSEVQILYKVKKYGRILVKIFHCRVPIHSGAPIPALLLLLGAILSIFSLLLLCSPSSVRPVGSIMGSFKEANFREITVVWIIAIRSSSSAKRNV